MVDTIFFVDEILKKIEFFSGIPDSLLKDFNQCIMDKCTSKNHIIPANEGSAVSLAAGYYLSKGKIPMVYMQNSGIGNSLNPLISLLDKYVYSIPLIMMIGHRGQQGIKDEPQHLKQGIITNDLLKVLDIPFSILPNDTEKAVECFNWAYYTAKQTLSPVAIIVRKSTFSPYNKIKNFQNPYTLTREDAIIAVTNVLKHVDSYKIFSTTGMISRELYEIREKNSQSHDTDFLAFGSMGHISQIALGYALNEANKKIICLDGDGSFLMHMGGAALVGTSQVDNFIHIVLNNMSHDSVGGQPTVAGKISITGVALACGYDKAFVCDSKETLEQKLSEVIECNGKFLIEVKVCKGARQDLGRPNMTAKEIKENFMRGIK